MWDALINDTLTRVMVMNAEGLVLYANARAEAQCGGEPDNPPILGRRLGEFLPAELAAERLCMIARVIESGRPMLVRGMYEGICIRTVYRRIPLDDAGAEEAGVLAIGRDVADLSAHDADALADCEIVDSEVQDLGPLAVLTPRELTVLAMIGGGHTTAEIADRLHRSEKTVEWHRTGMARKLGVRNRVELARLAVRAGLTPDAALAASRNAERISESAPL
jgi:DNA-binding CsgD family transcriptional regulator